MEPWPVRIFKDGPFSLYIVATSESEEGLIFAEIDPQGLDGENIYMVRINADGNWKKLGLVENSR